MNHLMPSLMLFTKLITRGTDTCLDGNCLLWRGWRRDRRWCVSRGNVSGVLRTGHVDRGLLYDVFGPFESGCLKACHWSTITTRSTTHLLWYLPSVVLWFCWLLWFSQTCRAVSEPTIFPYIQRPRIQWNHIQETLPWYTWQWVLVPMLLWIGRRKWIFEWNNAVSLYVLWHSKTFSRQGCTLSPLSFPLPDDFSINYCRRNFV